jgi:hypothetical protein
LEVAEFFEGSSGEAFEVERVRVVKVCDGFRIGGGDEGAVFELGFEVVSLAVEHAAHVGAKEAEEAEPPDGFSMIAGDADAVIGTAEASDEDGCHHGGA